MKKYCIIMHSNGISMDPQVLTDGETLDIHTLISEGLTYTNANGEVVPGLAKSWDISEDRISLDSFSFKRWY